MQRGKASIQHDPGDGQEALKTLDSQIGEVNSNHHREPPVSRAITRQPEEEMAGHIVDQLRRAYDELLHEPVPDHLRQLLTHLSETEDKS